MTEEKMWLVKVGEEWLLTTRSEVEASILSQANQATMMPLKMQAKIKRLGEEGRLKRV